MSEVKSLSKENFEAEVMAAGEPVLVDFWAPWCGPCRMVGPVIEEIAREFTGKLKVGKINIDENRDLADRFKIMSIPTLIFFKDGEEAHRVIGYQGKKELVDVINQIVEPVV